MEVVPRLRCWAVRRKSVPTACHPTRFPLPHSRFILIFPRLLENGLNSCFERRQEENKIPETSYGLPATWCRVSLTNRQQLHSFHTKKKKYFAAPVRPSSVKILPSPLFFSLFANVNKARLKNAIC